SSPVITNSVIWNNDEGGNKEAPGASIHNFNVSSDLVATVSYSLVANSGGSGDWSELIGADGGNNIDNDPLFSNVGISDYRLRAGSPAIDAGDEDSYSNAGGDLVSDMDLGGSPRYIGETIDMGAYEYKAPKIFPTDGILFVKKDATGDGSGSSWDNAIPELADALKWAREEWGEDGNGVEWGEDNPLQIWVAEGTYKPLYSAEDGKNDADGARDNSFVLVPYTQLYGGFAGDEVHRDERNWHTHPTILSGDIDNTEDLSDGDAYHVVVAIGQTGYPLDQNTVMDGFTVVGGNSNGSHGSNITVSGHTLDRNFGGGIASLYAAPVLSNLKVIGNNAYNGGGIYNFSAAPQ